jgi:hypothetical protein
MKVDEIAEVGIDPAGSLYIRPKTETFPYIYRAGMGISWDANCDRLFSPNAGDWSYATRFAQIRSAVKDEYGILLALSPATIWSLPEDVRSTIEGLG